MNDANLMNRITAIENSQTNFSLNNHQHLGSDSLSINYANIINRKIWVHHTIQGTNAATATNYSTFWIAPVRCFVSGFKEVHAALGTDGSAVTITLEKLTGTTVPGSGTVLLTTPLSLKSTINTVQTGVIIPTLASFNVAIGDRLALLKAGTLTSIANVTIMLEITLV